MNRRSEGFAVLLYTIVKIAMLLVLLDFGASEHMMDNEHYEITKEGDEVIYNKIIFIDIMGPVIIIAISVLVFIWVFT